MTWRQSCLLILTILEKIVFAWMLESWGPGSLGFMNWGVFEPFFFFFTVNSSRKNLCVDSAENNPDASEKNLDSMAWKLISCVQFQQKKKKEIKWLVIKQINVQESLVYRGYFVYE